MKEVEILLRDSTNSGKAGGGEEAVAMRQMEVANIDILLLLLLYLMEWLPSVKNSILFLGGSGQKV